MTPAVECAQCASPMYANRQHVCAIDCGIGVGENVRITNEDHFQYGGSAPFGGHIVALRAGEADVCFYDRDEDGGWSWQTWSLPIDDLAVMQ